MFSAGIISYNSGGEWFRFVALAENSTITVRYTNSGGQLQYSADKVTWTNINSGSSFTIPAWETRYMRGSGFSSNSLYNSLDSSNTRTISKPVECYWNINELINYTTPPTTLANYCYGFMFYLCSSLKTAPTLPATTLATGCYYNMFNWCTSLTTAPSLPAITMVAYCYQAMFYWCSSLKVSSTSTWSYIYAWRIPTSWTGTTATSWNTAMLTSTWWTFTSDPSINTTYYVENAPV